MKPKTFMVIAGETSGDILAAELVGSIRAELNHAPDHATWDYQPLHTSLQPRFFGAGGPQMAAAGVDLALDMTAHAVTGISEVLRNYLKFRRIFAQLFRLALEREPDAIICVDFSGFNRRFAHAIRQHQRSHHGWFHDWNPRIVQYVSPQVWASRESRAYQIAKDFDLILSIFPFEREWYASRVPQLHVEFVGHPLIDRYSTVPVPARVQLQEDPPMVLLLPGSRSGELKRHLPVLLDALGRIHQALPQVQARLVLPNEALAKRARQSSLPEFLHVQVGGLPAALQEADLAIASTGTVTLECAYFGVPAIALYRTSWVTWQIAKRIITVKYGAMPNLLADREIYPEFIQDAATAETIAKAALSLLKDKARRQQMKEELAEITHSLGSPGASTRAARAILGALTEPQGQPITAAA
jgi:lipid-A-disaccharide synthase